MDQPDALREKNQQQHARESFCAVNGHRGKILSPELCFVSRLPQVLSRNAELARVSVSCRNAVTGERNGFRTRDFAPSPRH
jgi:hypothetical protein